MSRLLASFSREVTIQGEGRVQLWTITTRWQACGITIELVQTRFPSLIFLSTLRSSYKVVGYPTILLQSRYRDSPFQIVGGGFRG